MKAVCITSLSLILLYAKFKVSLGCENYGDYLSSVNYYENLITTRINESYYYKLPTNAHSFKPRTNKVYGYGLYDFVIAGAGPTGSVIANRLSEIGNWKVLILEAGGPPSDFEEIPGMHEYLITSKFNWNYETVPQTKSCLGLTEKRCPVSRGKVLGGSSGINGLVYARGNKEDFNRWARQGNSGWSFEDVLPYYIKSENCQVDGDPNYHGKGGYWNVKRRKAVSPQFSAFVAAHEELLNCTYNNDYNGINQLGISSIQFNVIRNKRQGVGIAFLESVREQRKNLNILEKAFVTRVLINPRTKSAYGVEFTHNGRLYQVRSRKEVILSTGAIISPKLLMLSGIGPQEELSRLNVPLISDLPVGKILYEAPGFFGLFINTNRSGLGKPLRQNVKDYLADSGLFEVPGNGEGMGYYQSSFVKHVPGYQDLEFKFIGPPSISPYGKLNLGMTDETFNALWAEVIPETAINIYVIILQAKSIGSVNLATSDPYEYPLIDMNMLDDPRDIDILHQGVRLIKQLIETPAMRAINASLVLANYPQCTMFLLGSDDYWTCALRLLTATTYASFSTCRMGSNISESVVNDRLQVHGVRSLRVADLSIFPDPVSAAPTASAVMVGEKISDIIKQDYYQETGNYGNVFGKYA